MEIMKYPVIDLHCDLLSCVESNPSALNFESSATNCSIPHLLEGGVLCQVFAIATNTGKESTLPAKRQVALYEKLLAEYPEVLENLREHPLKEKKLHALLAIENASGLVEEDEPLERAFERCIQFSKVGKIFYVSLTWNHENRFGGGNASLTGLKEDGKIFLEFLAGKNIAIDLSHTSDALAYAILEYIHEKSLDLIPIASHSNFRLITNIQRNLPDEIAQAIISMGGLIGINFIRRFVGDDPEDFIKHIQHGLELAGENALCLGSDFYGGIDIPSHLMPERSFPTFQKEFGNSSCYPQFLSLLSKSFPKEILKKISYQNALNFLVRESVEYKAELF